MGNKENISRGELLKIIFNNLLSCNFKSKDYRTIEESEDIISELVDNKVFLPGTCVNGNIKTIKLNPEDAIENIRSAFVLAGLDHEFRRLEVEYKQSGFNYLYDYLLYDCIYEFDIYHKKYERLTYEETLNHLFRLLYDLLDIINKNILVDKVYDTSFVPNFVSKYLTCFIIDSTSTTSFQFNGSVLERFELLYSFYGLSITDSEKKVIIDLYKEEVKRINEKRKSGYKKSQIYTLDILDKYIVGNIIEKLVLKKDKEEVKEAGIVGQLEENIEVIRSEEVGADVNNLTIDDKIVFIKRKIEQLENLSKQEKELLAELDKIRVAQKQLLEEINGMKL